jgi:hypothetical protein
MAEHDVINIVQEPTELTPKERRELAERDRINKWKERQAKIQPGFSFKAHIGDDGTYIKPQFSDPNVTQLYKAEAQRAAMCAATGTASEEYSKLIFTQVYAGLFKVGAPDNTLAAAHEALLAMNPADEYEGMLCSRLLVLHDQYMHFMSIVTVPNQLQQIIDLSINRATKLMRVYNETLETLNRYRRKGEQKVTVQHVNVNNGGQAVISG